MKVPVAVMTYLNPVFVRGFEAFLADAHAAGVAGAIVPDLPVDEAASWIEACGRAHVDPVFLAAPGTSPERLRQVAEGSRGFVYCVATYGVTGAREELAGTARDVVEALRAVTDRPLLVGVGIGTPEQAAGACSFADGAIVGSAIVERLVRGDREGAIRLATAFREAISAGAPSSTERA